MENGIARRSSNGGVSRPSIPFIGLSRNAHPAGQRIYSLILKGFMEDVPEYMRMKSPHHFQISSYLYMEWLNDMHPEQSEEYRLPSEKPGPWEFLDAEAKVLVRKTQDDQIIYYTEHWDTPDMARQHIWGNDPEIIQSKKLFISH